MELNDPTIDSPGSEPAAVHPVSQGRPRVFQPSPVPFLEVRALGQTVVHRGGRKVLLPYEKTGVLLVFLMLEQHRAHRRSVLADALWPESDDSRKNLSVALFNLRKRLGDRDNQGQPLFLVTRETVRFNPQCSHWLDAAAVGADVPDLPESFLNLSQEHLAAARRQASLCRGEFLDGWEADDCTELAGWLETQRARYRQRSLALLECASACLEHIGRSREALRFAEQYLQIEPWDEAVHRRAMRMEAATGRHHAALARCRELEATLQRELAEPLCAETVALVKRIEAEANRLEALSGRSRLSPRFSRRPLTAISILLEKRGMEPEAYVLWVESLRHRLDTDELMVKGRVTVGEEGQLLLFFDPAERPERAMRRAVEVVLEEAGRRRREVQIGIFTGETIVAPERHFPDALGRVTATATLLAKRAGGGKVWICGCTEATLKGAVRVGCDCESPEKLTDGDINRRSMGPLWRRGVRRRLKVGNGPNYK